MARRKIGIIGAGNVGASTAAYLAMADLGDVVLIDIPEVGGMPKGKALDLQQAGAVLGYDTHLAGGSDYELMRGADIVILTAGVARKPGMDRMDLLKINTNIVGGCTDKIMEVAPDSIILVVSNPLDVMTYLSHRKSKKDRTKVFGMAGVLDCARYAAFLAMELNCSVKDVRAMVLGGHGDQMVPLPRYSTVYGIPITTLIPKERIAAINTRTQKGGGEIVELLKTGSAYYAPAASVVVMVKSILNDERRILPCCVRLQGEYGMENVYVGVPCMLGANGIEKVLDLELDRDERVMLEKSAAAVRKGMNELDTILG